MRSASTKCTKWFRGKKEGRGGRDLVFVGGQRRVLICAGRCGLEACIFFVIFLFLIFSGVGHRIFSGAGFWGLAPGPVAARIYGDGVKGDRGRVETGGLWGRRNKRKEKIKLRKGRETKECGGIEGIDEAFKLYMTSVWDKKPAQKDMEYGVTPGGFCQNPRGDPRWIRSGDPEIPDISGCRHVLAGFPSLFVPRTLVLWCGRMT